MSGTGRRPTLKDIAAETGLSMAAVSYALRGLQGTPETQQRVQEAAERLGYQADPVARALASGRSGSVGVLCASLEDLWQQRLAAALGRELLAPDRNAWIIDSAGDADRQLQLAQHLVDHRADAIVVIPIDPAAKSWAKIAQQAPVIAIGDALPAAKAKSEVLFDNDSGVSTALRRLADAGHRSVAVLSPSRRVEIESPVEEIAQRIAAGLKLKIRIIPCPHDLSGATGVARELLTSKQRPTGILALADSMAFGVYAACRELDIRIPDDLSLLGYDDQPMSQLLTPPLSTFHWPLDDLVADVVARVTSAVDTNRRVRRTTVEPTLIERGSVAAPPTKA
ncbi:LacI family transcriptional regulator [Kribbella orskensis]|uniref:LacI family transcriptional regulator n=1 Tax=Kribbella orskensis TaxID=2512216 RepID=A0ABY2BQV5_9ACTN|nr:MULTISPECIES: LacI family DNA-binding transcriptional regulator [Kribbella]TCN29304.1 LacI family transcriptional regulator [Kribbella sp. VKM Ac-2500]TCO27994.1 LacI family transcriptional regulator [Kribbella orskensis]